MDLMFPQDVDPSEVRWSAIDSSSAYPSDTIGLIRTSEIVGGGALNPTFIWPLLKNEAASFRQRARALAVLKALRGQANRIWLPIPGHEEPSWAPELFTNNSFGNGAAGWTADNGVLTTPDRVGRLTTSLGGNNVQFRQAVALTQYAPHALRVMILDGAQSAGLSIGPSLTSATVSAQGYSAARGLKTVSLVAENAASLNQFPAVFSSTTGFTAGAYIEVPWCSLARCALVDNSPNLLIRSDDFFTSWTQSNLSAPTANNTDAAPDGTTTGETIAENTATSTHYLYQSATVSSAVGDYAFSVSLKASSLAFAAISMQEQTSNHECYVFVNLSSGALANTATSGANWTNPRSYVVNQGNGWWRVTIVGRKTSATTGINAIIYLANDTSTLNYLGSSRAITAYGASLSLSSVPVRYTATTTAATTGTAQTGNSLNLKGLPASTNDLRKVGQWVQIGRELHQLAANLNSDAAGCAFMQLCNPIRNAPADNDPVIFNRPMGKYLQAKNIFDWVDKPGVFTDLEVEFLEATAG